MRSAVIITSIAAFLATILLLVLPLRKDLERNSSEVIPLKIWRVNDPFCSGFSHEIDLSEKKDKDKYSQYINRTGCSSFQASVFIPDNLSLITTAIFFPGIDDADETFFNGILIGKTGRFPLSENNPDGYISAWVYPRVYILPGNIIKYNSENLIEVRIYNHSGQGGFSELSVPLIGDYSFLTKKSRLISFERNIPRIVAISCLGVFAVYLVFLIVALSGRGITRYFLQTIMHDIMPVELFKPYNLEEFKRYNFPYDLAVKYMYAVFMILFLIIFMFYEIVYGDSGLPGMAVYGVKYHMHILYLGFIFLILFFRRDFFSGFGGENNKCSKIIIIFFKFITSPVLFLIYSVLVFMQSSISYYSDFIDRGYWVILFFLSVFGTKYVVNFVVLFSKNVGRNRKHFLFKNFFHMIFVFTSCLTVFLYLSKNPYVSENGIVFGIILCVLAINLIISSDDKHFKLYKSMSKVISEVSEDSNSRIAAARRFIERNAYSDISRSDIAAAVGMSPEYLSRMFAASTGKTLSDYVTEIRIKNASELLISTDKTVIEICFDSGFSSLRTFNRTFQKYFLMNPTSFRQKKNAAFGKF